MTTLLRTLVFALAVLAFSSATAIAQHAEQEKPKPAGEKPPASGDATDHSQHHQHSGELPAFIPRVTDEDRRAAFPDVEGHTTHDNRWNYFSLFDQLEWQSNAGGTGVNVDTKAWVGGDRNRFWFRAEGDGEDGRVGEAETHVLFGRQIARWWDLVAGVRQDFEPGPARTWAAFGV